MRDIFEQFTFIPEILDAKSNRVQQSMFWGGIGTVMLQATKFYKYAASNILGVSIYLFSALLIVMVVDYITGIRVARKEGIERKSKKGLRWVIKLGVYLFTIFIINALNHEVQEYTHIEIIEEGLVMILGLFKYYVLLHIIYWETKSVDENLEKLGYSFQILKLFDVLYGLILSFTNTHVKHKTGVESALEDDRKKKEENHATKIKNNGIKNYKLRK